MPHSHTCLRVARLFFSRVKYLLGAGADPDVRDAKGVSVTEYIKRISFHLQKKHSDTEFYDVSIAPYWKHYVGIASSALAIYGARLAYQHSAFHLTHQ